MTKTRYRLKNCVIWYRPDAPKFNGRLFKIPAEPVCRDGEKYLVGKPVFPLTPARQPAGDWWNDDEKTFYTISAGKFIPAEILCPYLGELVDSTALAAFVLEKLEAVAVWLTQNAPTLLALLAESQFKKSDLPEFEAVEPAIDAVKDLRYTSDAVRIKKSSAELLAPMSLRMKTLRAVEESLTKSGDEEAA